MRFPQVQKENYLHKRNQANRIKRRNHRKVMLKIKFRKKIIMISRRDCLASKLYRSWLFLRVINDFQIDILRIRQHMKLF